MTLESPDVLKKELRGSLVSIETNLTDPPEHQISDPRERFKELEQKTVFNRGSKENEEYEQLKVKLKK